MQLYGINLDEIERVLAGAGKIKTDLAPLLGVKPPAVRAAFAAARESGWTLKQIISYAAALTALIGDTVLPAHIMDGRETPPPRLRRKRRPAKGGRR